MKEKKKKNKQQSDTKKKNIKSKKTNTKSANNKLIKKDTKMKFKYKHPKLAIALKILLVLIILLVVIGSGVIVGLIYGFFGDDLKIDLSKLTMIENTVIVDSNENVLAELNGKESRKIITLDEMSPYLPKAYIAIEDERFYQHHGVDLKRTTAAILSFVTHFGKSTTGGGSTITQQLVKNITQDKESSGIDGVLRKVKEWAKAYQVEKELSKNQILELYLNLILVGGRNYGVQTGAEYYFNTDASNLSIAQCAFLAGINNSPNRYNPYSETDHTELITKRTKTVLGQMKKCGYINQEEYDSAVAEVEAGFKFENGVKGNVYSSHTDALITQLIEQIAEEKNISKTAAETYLNTSGLRIYSTQDSDIQKIMEEEMSNSRYVLPGKDSNGNDVTAEAAAVVIDPATGYVVGAVGQLGEKTTARGLNRINSPRQTGSSIKPLSDVLPGIEEGIITPATVYLDTKTTFGGTWTPKNYNRYTGKCSIRTALTTSQNIPFIKVQAELTPTKGIEYLKKMGVSTLDDEKDNNLASIAIGGFTYGISPLEMAAAYAMVSNDGVYIKPTFYTKAVDSSGNTVLSPTQTTERVCSEQTAYIVKDLMKSVVNDSKGTATYTRISGMDLAAKTGTTNGDKERWMCGFTNYYSCAVIYAFDEPQTVTKLSKQSSGLIFANIMKEIHQGLEGSEFKQPDGIVSARVCRTSGFLASDKCSDTYIEIFVEGKLPETCDAHKGSYTICKDSGLLANKYCPESSKEVKDTGYVIEKERLGLWNTLEGLESENSAPTKYCTIHKAPEIKKTESTKPTESTKQTESTKPAESTKPVENTSSTKPTETTKPTESTKPSGNDNTTPDLPKEDTNTEE